MDHSTNKASPLLKGIKRCVQKIRRLTCIVLAASMIGFSNAFYDEHKMLSDIRCFIQQEQVMDEEDLLE